MTTHRALKALVAATLLASTLGPAVAADTQNLNVTASVQGVCRFSSTVQTLSFGTLNPATDGATTAGTGAAVKYKCTKGTAAAGVTADTGLHVSGGTRRMQHATVVADFIPYTLTITQGTQTGLGFGSGNDLSLGVAGAVALTDYANVTAGNYSDTVILSITP